MATPVVFNAVNYSVPAFGDVGYAQGPGNLSAYLIALASGTLQPTGGLFSLTSDANFGPNFGLVSVYYKTASANIATSGEFRLAVGDTIEWRNNANTLNLPLGVNGLDQLTFNGVVISTAAAGGTVNPGLQFEIPYYAANGNTVSAAANIHYNAAGNFELLGGHSVVFDGATSGAVTMKAPAIVTTPWTFTLPPTPGTNAYFLQTNGAGITTWAQVQTTAFREDYIAGTPSGTYTGSLTVFNLANPYGVGAHTLIVTLDGDVQTAGASADYIETNTTTVTFNFATVAGERVSFLFNAPVTSIGGTVNSGTAPRLAQYAASGTTISEIGSNASANSFKITSLANGTTATDAAAFGQIKYLQAVQGTSIANNTSTLSAFASTGLAVTITPTSASNRIKVTVNGTVRGRGAASRVIWRLDRSGVALPTLGEMGDVTTSIEFPLSFSYIDSPATTSATTYTLQLGSNSGVTGWDFNANSLTQVIIAEEVV